MGEVDKGLQRNFRSTGCDCLSNVAVELVKLFTVELENICAVELVRLSV